MLIARQSTARTVTVGPVLDADGVAVTDGVVADFKIAKNGGAPAALNASATLTHRNTGHYSLALTASDLDTAGTAEVVIDDLTNACPLKEITVVEEAVYDALYAAGALGYVADAPVNVAQISGDSTAADRLEALLDATPTGTVNADGSETTSSFKTDLTGADDFWNGSFLVFTSGALIGQSRKVSDFVDVDGVVTLASALTAAPANGVSFMVLGRSE